MTSPTALHLYFLRLIALLAQSALLIAGTVLFAFGMLDLFTVLAALALLVTWAVLHPAASRARSALEYDQHRIGENVDDAGRAREGAGRTGITLARYTSIRGVFARVRARKALAIRADRFDLAFAVLTTLVWLSYFGFIGSVLSGA